MKAPENGDDDLDAFMQGRDALSQRLKAMRQPEPPEALSAAIEARVERDLLNEKKRPQAANDSVGGDGVVMRPRSRRLFASMALAAGLLLVVGVSMQWRQNSEPDPAVIAQSAAPAASAAPEAPEAASAAVPAQAAALPSPSPSTVRAPQQPAPPKMLAQADIAPLPSSTVVRSGPPPASAPAVASASASAGDDKASQWLTMIDGLLTNGMRRDALEEWREFRRAYPDYPVAQPLKARIDEAGQAAAAPADNK